METNHTPTPWTSGVTRLIAGGYKSRISSGSTPICEVFTTTGADPKRAETVANAAFIVRACNAHEKLLAIVIKCSKLKHLPLEVLNEIETVISDKELFPLP